VALPDLNYSEIRGHGPLGSRASGFEELASVLVREVLVDWPMGTKFERFGDPDGGREGRGILPNGDVWAWQAKYLFGLNSSALAQLKSSVVRAIETEPRLTRYFVLLPYDRPAGDSTSTESAAARWRRHVEAWRELAGARGLQVEFEYIGAHEITTALTRSDQVGRLRYWFDKTALSPEWFEGVVDQAIQLSGPRYTPELHIDLPIADIFEALGRTERFQLRWRELLGRLRRAREYRWSTPEGPGNLFEPLLDAAWQALDALDASLVACVEVATSIDPMPVVGEAVERSNSTLGAIDDALHQHCRSGNGYFIGDSASLYAHVERTARVIDDVYTLRSQAEDVVARRLLVLEGNGGTGKTHLLCDVARSRNDRNLPTLIVCGQQFDSRERLLQISELVHFSGQPAELLPALEAAAEAANSTALVIVDAINEGDAPEAWRDALPLLAVQVLAHPHLALVVSCRTQFLDTLIPDSILAAAAVLEHHGFAEAAQQAMTRYLTAYGIEHPSFPMLEPEFGNPLFLKLLCTTMSRRGETRFPRTGLRLTWLYDAYLDSLDTVLSAKNRCDYDKSDGLVRKAVDGFVSEMLAGAGQLTRDRARSIADDLLPGRTWSGSLLKALQDEGVVGAFGEPDKLQFGYQRLGDTAGATQIASLDLETAKTRCRALAEQWWRNAGILEALSVTMPEAHSVELIDVLRTDDGVPIQAASDFLAGLSWRGAAGITPRSLELVSRSLELDRLRRETWLTLVRISTVDGHPLNAELLHALLIAMPLPARDASWTPVINSSGHESRPVGALIEWAASHEGTEADESVSYLALMTLAWCFAATNRRVRDRATKAAVNLAEGHATTLARVLRQFTDVNDPYISERLLATACGVALRGVDRQDVLTIAEAVADTTIRTHWPEDIWTRDYARRVLERAFERGWEPPDLTAEDVRPPYESEWPAKTRSEREINDLCKEPDYEYSSIWHSLDGFGDFGHYQVESSLGNFGKLSKQEASLVKRRIFDRVLELGWTPEQFKSYDHDKRWEPSSGQITERIGKKYQWIAFHETLGRITDHHAVGGKWRDDPLRPYAIPADVAYRDIDPSLTLPQSLHVSWDDTPQTWFSPEPAAFAGTLDGNAVTDIDGVPDPMSLLALTDDDGEFWLPLEAHHQWSEPQFPETAALGQPHRRVWLQIRSYLVQLAELDSTLSWALSQDWSGRWMPEAAEVSGLLLADHPRHVSWDEVYDQDDEHFWRGQTAPPSRLVVSTTFYSGTGSSRDQSSDDTITGFLPSRGLHDLLQLHRTRDFEWTNERGQLTVQDPGMRTRGNASLVVRRDALTASLAQAGTALVWTLLGEKEPVFSSLHRHPEHFTWTELTATYALREADVLLVNAVARTRTPGPATTDVIPWTPSAIG
jgi:hypothetical protein